MIFLFLSLNLVINSSNIDIHAAAGTPGSTKAEVQPEPEQGLVNGR